MGLVDVFDALTSNRVYREAMDLDRTLAIIRKERGRHFEPRLVDLFLDHLDEFLVIHDQNPDRKDGSVSLPETESEPVLV